MEDSKTPPEESASSWDQDAQETGESKTGEPEYLSEQEVRELQASLKSKLRSLEKRSFRFKNP